MRVVTRGCSPGRLLRDDAWGRDRAQAGELRFEDEFPDLLRMALGAAARILGKGPAAEGVAAEALARLWLRWAKVADLDYRDAWLVRVTTNLALD